AGPDHPERERRAVGKIDLAPFAKRAAIVDSHLDRAPACEIGHDHARAQRKDARSGGHLVLVVDFAGRGRTTVEPRTLPRPPASPRGVLQPSRTRRSRPPRSSEPLVRRTPPPSRTRPSRVRAAATSTATPAPLWAIIGGSVQLKKYARHGAPKSRC